MASIPEGYGNLEQFTRLYGQIAGLQDVGPKGKIAQLSPGKAANLRITKVSNRAMKKHKRVNKASSIAEGNMALISRIGTQLERELQDIGANFARVKDNPLELIALKRSLSRLKASLLAARMALDIFHQSLKGGINTEGNEAIERQKEFSLGLIKSTDAFLSLVQITLDEDFGDKFRYFEDMNCLLGGALSEVRFTAELSATGTKDETSATALAKQSFARAEFEDAGSLAREARFAHGRLKQERGITASLLHSAKLEGAWKKMKAEGSSANLGVLQRDISRQRVIIGGKELDASLPIPDLMRVFSEKVSVLCGGDQEMALKCALFATQATMGNVLVAINDSYGGLDMLMPHGLSVTDLVLPDGLSKDPSVYRFYLEPDSATGVMRPKLEVTKTFVLEFFYEKKTVAFIRAKTVIDFARDTATYQWTRPCERQEDLAIAEEEDMDLRALDISALPPGKPPSAEKRGAAGNRPDPGPGSGDDDWVVL